MRRMTLGLLACLLMTACTIGIVKQETFAPVATADVQATDNARVATSVAGTVTAILANTATPTTALSISVPLTVSPPPPTVTPLATSKPTTSPRPSSTPVASPAIQYFNASSYEIALNGSVSLFWSSTGGVRATLRRTTASGAGGFEREVPPSGSLTVDSQGAGRHWHDYELVVYNSAGISDRRSLTIRFVCSHNFFFRADSASYLYDPRLCPDGPPQSTQAAEQIFEGGRMIWLEHAAPIRQWDWGTGGNDDFIILALYAPGVAWPQKQTFIDAWSPKEPDSDPSIVPPEGKFQPVRGFGKAWRTHSDVRQKLGWALSQEKAYGATFQFVSDFYGRSECLYLSLANGRIVSMCRRDGSWGFVNP